VFNLTGKFAIRQTMKFGVWIYTKQGCTLVDTDISDKLDHSKIFLQKKCGYRRAFYVEKSKVLYLHRLIVNAPKGLTVDHIDRNALNNMRQNLRICTQALNNQNKKKSSRSKAFLKGLTIKRGRVFYEYTESGKNVRSQQYFSQKMAYLDYCLIKKDQSGDYFYGADINKYQLEEIVPKKAKPTIRNKTGYVGVVRTGKTFIVSFKHGNLLIQESGFKNPKDAAIRYDELCFSHNGYFSILNFPENYRIFL
jgi:hypothetical protein